MTCSCWGTDRRPHVRARVRAGTLASTVVALVLGVYMAAQWQSRPRRADPAPEYRTEVAAATIRRLESEQADLKTRIAALRAQLTSGQEDIAGRRDDLRRVAAELAHESMLAGTVPVRGPGLRLVLDDSPVKKAPPKEDPGQYFVQEYHLRDVLNLLWAAGAEAVSLNGERVVASTSTYRVGPAILVNDTMTSAPYEFLVIADRAAVESMLADPSQLRSLKSRVKVYSLQFIVQQLEEVVVPAYTGSLVVRHAATVVRQRVDAGRGAVE